MSTDDSLHNVQAEAGPFTHRLCREKWIENLALDFRRYAQPVVDDFHEHEFWLGSRSNFEDSFSGRQGSHRINGIVDQIGPNLIQLTPVRWNFGQMSVEFPFHLNPMLEL